MMPPLRVDDLLLFLEQQFPLSLAASWDNVGLILGERDAEVLSIMTCLTVTPEVVEEAITRQVNLIVSHHPMLFKLVQRITSDKVEGRMLLRLLNHKIALYSPHTAYDNATSGINQQLATGLGLANIRPLVPAAEEASKQVKVAVFVPQSDLAKVSEAMFQAGAGRIGAYRECSFRATGTGTFYGTEATNPTVGEKGKREEVVEERLEVIVPVSKLGDIISAMKQSHSYEEPAFDVYPLQSVPSGSGSGRIGDFSKPISPAQLADQVKKLLNIHQVLLTGDTKQKEIRRLAIVCGSGGSWVSKAFGWPNTAFLTGEMSFHEELAAQAAGVTVIVAGHYATERPGIEKLATLLSDTFPQLTCFASKTETNPSRWV